MGNTDNSNVVIYLKRDQAKNFILEDPVLKDKELIAVYDEDKLIGHKIGDGKSKWSELDYVDLDLIDEFKVYDGKMGYACRIILNPVDKMRVTLQNNKNNTDF